MHDPVLLHERDVARLLCYADLIPLMKRVTMQFSAGATMQPTRQMLPVEPDARFLGLMPAVLPDAMGAKLVSFYPKNASASLPTHFASIVLLDAEDGHPLAYMDGRLITEMRTAALSAAVSQVLAAPESRVLALIGAGVQARAHLEALRQLHDFTEVRVWSRSEERARRFAGQHGAVACSIPDAVSEADIVVVATNARDPLVRGAWIKPGSFVASVGSPRPDWRELDDDLMRGHPLVVDSREAVVVESGDVIMSGAAIAGEAGDLFAGRLELKRGRTAVFKSVGIAVQDIATAMHVYQRFLQDRGAREEH